MLRRSFFVTLPAFAWLTTAGRSALGAPEDVEIEAIEPVERAARVLQAVELALADPQGEDRVNDALKDQT